MDTVQKARLALSSLGLYRPLLEKPVVAAFAKVLETAHGAELRGFLDAYGAFISLLAPARATAGVLDFSGALHTLVQQNDSLFARQAAAGRVEEAVRAAAARDLEALSMALDLSPREIKAAASASFDDDDSVAFIDSLPDFITGGSFSTEETKQFHATHGCGVFASFGAFKWQRGVSGDSSLFGISSPDPVRLAQLKGYEYERNIVLENTANFLDGISANNMLLYGDRGTGKSSTVKAVFNEFRGRGLRIIEVSKDCIVEFARIIERIGSVPLKFIIFIDDLSFSDDDDNYSALKAVLEGGVAARPRNTVIYATSNRRHFVKESFSERDSEIHAGDAMQEKLSLADRFGITVTFTSPDQRLYFDIVRALAADRGLDVDGAQLERGAAQWALRYNGRSPRTATQYIDWVAGRIKKGLPLDDF
ncbi:ATP-binding protein [Ethanoligenens harbinense]|uniref:AAA+ ATPase domain-containing protein n=1 Tax=Ethanoligenens harbinense (strain DSM 18485 / JCM 12961 / CGMCC 1.5033 / YUAN-3) TaxID=663278 RepID=E6U6N4_ETHHY|nr:ATP-binding protein [Ethanoligenens harbinense]ADU25767.1 protein of unknown function DUF815 [Ethanoligenens harbinense YUAN-3]AVQ94937.1 DUF815 domain-containing protein [Ethanoligenens harbinense YUAN-3]AYF37629.1 DUF815 domain-containing protein [Ethanoligenens harbinense]AYF40349.1 DUF815 domain-containing protein [Ethanoligenens harbinense]QCN91185.1 ATP-binding protein [Ethanoligenens harbinense]